MQNELKIVTLNTHKGMASFNLRGVSDKQRILLRSLDADLVFLQEVTGFHALRLTTLPEKQYEFLADKVWPSYAYGQNAVSSKGHHGNAILSKFPIMQWDNQDISASKAEQRGMLHCQIAIPNWDQHLHCICVHLGLLGHWRKQQLSALNTRINQLVPHNAPLIIAGDFNDWGQHASALLKEQQQLKEAFKTAHGRYAKSFPAFLPLFRLDRIYVRGFDVLDCNVHAFTQHSKVSDHTALFAKIMRI
ncbi:MAG: endonuclease/exonuclease/phosphatase family protein [Methylophilaceae bacterium]